MEPASSFAFSFLGQIKFQINRMVPTFSGFSATLLSGAVCKCMCVCVCIFLQFVRLGAGYIICSVVIDWFLWVEEKLTLTFCEPNLKQAPAAADGENFKIEKENNYFPNSGKKMFRSVLRGNSETIFDDRFCVLMEILCAFFAMITYL